jgi:UDP-N-acetylglucosamine--N-acetylmuramyl-(pentapeptide) pyrophosphoryl-undecaprenol N-acetylglucosamine transferase
VTGNPLRKEVAREDFPKHQPQAKSLLIMGGSQGAHAINQVVVEKLDEMKACFPDIKIVHQTGQKDLDSTRAAYQARFNGTAEVVPFISDMAGAYAKAAFVIARSGALTVSELISVGRPALLVPFPRKGQNDQVTNAYYLEKNGAARVVEQGEDFSKRFWETFVSVFEPSRLAEMGQNASRLRIGGALATIGDQIEAEISQGK